MTSFRLIRIGFKYSFKSNRHAAHSAHQVEMKHFARIAKRLIHCHTRDASATLGMTAFWLRLRSHNTLLAGRVAGRNLGFDGGGGFVAQLPGGFAAAEAREQQAADGNHRGPNQRGPAQLRDFA